MSIQSFDKQFGSATKAQTGDKRDLPKAQIWMNIGYMSDEFTNAEGKAERRFISLPNGLPIDTMDKVEEKSSSEVFRAMRAAQNDLLDQIIAKGNALQPGEEVILAMGDNGLAVQLRRVKAEQAPLPADQNPLAKKLAF